MSKTDGRSPVDDLLEHARAAQWRYERLGSQALYDRAALAAGWAIMEPARNRALAELAVETTGLGNVADKITKNHRKTLGLLRDIKTARTYGVIDDDPATGITQIARPIGVIGAVVPSTNPGATPANNIINALKCGNAIILSPSPKGASTCRRLLDFVHAEFDKAGVDRNLVQMIPASGSKALTQRLLELADLAIVTGSQDNVRRAYTSGTPAIAVGVGNVTAIVDESADLAAAARKIAASKIFDNATSCSSENAVIAVDKIYDAFLSELAKAGGAVIRDDAAIATKLQINGALNRDLVAQDASRVITALDLTGKVAESNTFIAVETACIGPDHPLSGEKLSLILSVYRAPDFEAALKTASKILRHQGIGHSIGIHTSIERRALRLGNELPVCRVIVNQAHTFATGGSFTNGMPFSLSMGCGSWAGNSIDTNLHWRHFMQTTKIVRETASNEPSLDEIFADYWACAGR